MLPKVSSAISALIAPITSSTSQGANQAGKGGKEFQRFNAANKGKGGQEKPPGDSQAEEAKVIPLRPGQGSSIPEGQALATPAQPNIATLSTAHAFVHLLGMFGNQSRAIAQWLGNRAYQKTSAMKKGYKTKLGAMLDTRVE